MELFKGILVRALAKEEINTIFLNLEFSAIEVAEIESFIALQKNKDSH